MIHSPEPWRIERAGSEACPLDSGHLLAADDTSIAGYGSDEGEFRADDPNYQRIVACVNFCRGVSLGWLSTHTIDEVIDVSMLKEQPK